MKEMLIDYAGFLLETVTVLVAFIIAVIFVAAKSVSSVGSHADSESDGDGDKSSRVVIRNESAKYQEEVDRLRLDLLDDDSRKCVDEFMKKKEKSSGSKKSDEAKKLDEALKALTRTNKVITEETIHDFVDGLQVSDAVKAELKAITPHNYTGI